MPYQYLKSFKTIFLGSLRTDPSATYDVPAWASGRPSRVVVSSAAGLIITVTDDEGEVIEREAECATGPGPVAHPASRSMTSPAPSVALMIRPAADETTTRDGRPLGQAGTSYVANGPALYAR